MTLDIGGIEQQSAQLSAEWGVSRFVGFYHRKPSSPQVLLYGGDNRRFSGAINAVDNDKSLGIFRRKRLEGNQHLTHLGGEV